MSLSSAIAVLSALAGCLAFHFLKGGGDHPPSQQAYVSVAVWSANCAAIISLFVVLVIGRTKSDADFGKLIRGESGTIVGALLISLVYTGYDLLRSFSP